VSELKLTLSEQLDNSQRIAKRERIRAERAETELAETRQQLVDLQHGTKYEGALGELRYWGEKLTAKTVSAVRRARSRVNR
jgi:hypothetical protein